MEHFNGAPVDLKQRQNRYFFDIFSKNKKQISTPDKREVNWDKCLGEKISSRFHIMLFGFGFVLRMIEVEE